MLPSFQVQCQTDGCRARGKTQTVRLQNVAINLVQRPDLLCSLCGAAPVTVRPWQAPALSAEEGTDMPKVTRHGGPSNAGTPESGVTHTDQPPIGGTGEPAAAAFREGKDAPDKDRTFADPALEERAAASGTGSDEPEGGEQPSAGSSSETSSEKPAKSSKPSRPASQKRARTTGSRSGKDQTDSSTAPSTDGDQTAASSETESSSDE